MFVEDNPEATLDEVLAHYGVAGMKWGRRRAKANGSDIREARVNLHKQRVDIHKAKKAARQINDPTSKAMAKAKVGEMKSAFLNNPDRVVAARLTRGEKAIALLLLPAGGTSVAVTSMHSRRIEYKQNKAAGVKP
jgi:hypothetical protein